MHASHSFLRPTRPHPPTRQALYYLDSVRRTGRAFVFMLLTLPWFQVMFRVVLCSRACTEPQYVSVTDVLWKLLVCLMLFTLANFLKAVITKLLSSHFYKARACGGGGRPVLLAA